MALLDGKRALVTGGSKGIGAGISLALAREGADVAVNYHSDKEGAEAIVREIESFGRKAAALGANVGQVAECQRLVTEAAECELERGRRRRVQPLEVVDGDHDRRPVGERAQQREERRGEGDR